MRVIGVLLTLVTVPLMTSAAQSPKSRGQGHNEVHCAARIAKHPGKVINKCEKVPPPPSTACAVTPPSTAGTLFISGDVWLDIDPWPGLAGWCVELTGRVNATAMTDAAGRFLFDGLPEGLYTVCAVLPSGWAQAFPTEGSTCRTGGFGWEFQLAGYPAGVSFYVSQP
jgi:hypothetical protein